MGLGTARQKLALGRGTTPTLSLRACSRRYGLHSSRRDWAGVAADISHPDPFSSDAQLSHRCSGLRVESGLKAESGERTRVGGAAPRLDFVLAESVEVQDLQAHLRLQLAVVGGGGSHRARDLRRPKLQGRENTRESDFSEKTTRDQGGSNLRVDCELHVHGRCAGAGRVCGQLRQPRLTRGVVHRLFDESPPVGPVAVRVLERLQPPPSEH